MGFGSRSSLRKARKRVICTKPPTRAWKTAVLWRCCVGCAGCRFPCHSPAAPERMQIRSFARREVRGAGASSPLPGVRGGKPRKIESQSEAICQGHPSSMSLAAAGAGWLPPCRGDSGASSPRRIQIVGKKLTGLSKHSFFNRVVAVPVRCKTFLYAVLCW